MSGLLTSGLIKPNVGGAPLTYAQEVLADAPWAYWPLSTAPSGVSPDASGNGHDFSVTGTPVFTGAQLLKNVAGASMVVSANGQSLSCTYDAAILGGSLTAEMWFEPTNLATGQPKGLFQWGNSELALTPRAGDSGVAFGKMQSYIGGSVRTTPIAVVSANGVIHHMVMVYDHVTGTTSYYVNGAFLTSVTGAAGAFNPTVGQLLRYPFDFGSGRETFGRHGHLALYKGVLSAARILAHYTAAGGVNIPDQAYRTVVQGDGLTQFWTMTELTTGGSPVPNIAPSGSAGSMQTPGSGWTAPGAAIFSGLGSSVDFGGGSAVYVFASPPALTTASFEIFIRPTNIGTGNKGIWDQNNGTRYARITAAGALEIQFPGATLTSANGLLANNTEYHIVVTYNSSTGAIVGYINGTSVVTGTATTGSSVGGFLRWPWAVANGNELAGRISHLAMYPLVLSPTQVAAHYAARN